MSAQICETCKKKGSRCYCPPNSTCDAYEQRVITHFEEIKMMDVDELAELLDSFRSCGNCRRNGNNCFPTFKTKEWLESEVE